MSETNGPITKQDLRDSLTEMAQHILHEIGLRFDGVDKRFDSLDSRLKVHAGMLQGGARAMARFSAFTEESEARWVELLGRVEALERKIGGGAGKA